MERLLRGRRRATVILAGAVGLIAGSFAIGYHSQRLGLVNARNLDMIIGAQNEVAQLTIVDGLLQKGCIDQARAYIDHEIDTSLWSAHNLAARGISTGARESLIESDFTFWQRIEAYQPKQYIDWRMSDCTSHLTSTE